MTLLVFPWGSRDGLLALTPWQITWTNDALGGSAVVAITLLAALGVGVVAVVATTAAAAAAAGAGAAAGGAAAAAAVVL